MSRVMAVFTWKGDTATLMDNYDRILAQVVAVSPARPVVHLASATDTGFQVMDVWDSEHLCRSMIDNPAFREKLAEYGLDDVTITVNPLHNLGWPVSEVPMYR